MRFFKPWLLGSSSLVASIVLVGGLTRLEEGGLSMVDWHPLPGLPPMNVKEWEEEFDRYKAYPEYQKKNRGMSLKEFQYIYWYEYIHRQMGRAVGVTFILPAMYYGYKYPHLRKRLGTISALICGQGLMGWYMVKSGLDKDHRLMKEYNNIPRVSQYRLASHLGLALTIYSSMIWTYLDQTKNQVTNVPKSFRFLIPLSFSLLFATIISGAFVAGMDAGLVYNEFPYMGDSIIPPKMWTIEPKWRNIFENTVTVQFNHRMMAMITTSIIFYLFLNRKKVPTLSKPIGVFMGFCLLQVTLGISTLLTFVPTSLAASHQLNSLSLLTSALYLLHKIKK